MYIGLYFGSFNPIHQGHLIIAEQALKLNDINEVWFVVSPQNPFKSENQLLNSRNRLHMVRLAIENAEGLRATDIEFHLPKPSYTADTLLYLGEKYPQHQFKIILGSDGFKNIERWKNSSFLINNFEFLVYHRPGNNIEAASGIKYQTIEGPMIDISSSYIRTEINENRSIRFLVPEAVRDEIERGNYYKLKN